jgi:hypothetical protein
MSHYKTMITTIVAATVTGLTFGIAHAGERNANHHRARWKIANAPAGDPTLVASDPMFRGGDRRRAHL